jgi:cysteine-rich repeat protein
LKLNGALLWALASSAALLSSCNDLLGIRVDPRSEPNTTFDTPSDAGGRSGATFESTTEATSGRALASGADSSSLGGPSDTQSVASSTSESDDPSSVGPSSGVPRSDDSTERGPITSTSPTTGPEPSTTSQSSELELDAGASTETIASGECGNGATERGESCDDENREAFDGCSADCQLENWSLRVNGRLSPAFDPNVTEYTVTLPVFIESLYLQGESPEAATFAVNSLTLDDGSWSSHAMYWGEQTSVELSVVVGADVIRTYALHVTRTDPEELYFKASNTSSGDTFGISVTLSEDGSTLAVGAKREDGSKLSDGSVEGSDELMVDAGAVYVYQRDATGEWLQQAYLKPFNPRQDDHFGNSVALSADGDMLAVGAPGESGGGRGVSNDPSPTNSSPGSGAVYVFVRQDGQWAQHAYFKASNNGRGEEFGKDLALSADGNTLAVAAPNESGSEGGVGEGKFTDSLCGMSGAVYVFVRGSTNAWTQQAYIKPSEPEYMAVFGSSLALSADGDTLAVGAFWADHVVGVVEQVDAGDAGPVVEKIMNSGAAYVFSRTGNLWAEQVRLEPTYVGESYEFGHSVALSGDGNTLAVGAHHEDLNPPPLGEDALPETRWGAGAAYVYVRTQAEWVQDAYLTAPSAGNNDNFGVSLSFNTAGTLLAVGAHQENGSGTLVTDGININDASFESGAVYVFHRELGQAWNFCGYVKAVNTNDSDLFGWSVDFSGDGSALAIGAYNEDNPGVGLHANPNERGANLAGAVYVVQ